jgi:hypothetical protein
MLIAMLFSSLLVFATVLVHYEVMRYTSQLLPHLTIRPRQLILVVIAAMFLAHTVEVWMHAYVFYLITHQFGLGGFGGAFSGEFHDYLYFSTVTYTSLGLGDVYPLGGLRLMAGVESLAGLVMIAWSASFAYLNMEKFWNMHAADKPRRRRKK